METGKIKKLMKDRGFGFITASDGREIFFHRSECTGIDFNTLEQGQMVDFELEIVPKGPRARKVSRAGGGHA